MLRLGDVAEVTLGGTEEATAMSVMGKPSVGMGIIRSSTANPLDVTKGVRAL
ncbi:MAG: efflux RND transporter permease subunit [Rhodospirillum sp.]|nr:efflux RND transporter permease subunit [Rhodospirillum sp.]MCF8491107.1 efflux RND transporter permease subunit [Rhodospirillum sp.]MCF8502795.1 efflux RND transporter permease subunit [Rhodospirillum sp.]